MHIDNSEKSIFLIKIKDNKSKYWYYQSTMTIDSTYDTSVVKKYLLSGFLWKLNLMVTGHFQPLLIYLLLFIYLYRY